MLKCDICGGEIDESLEHYQNLKHDPNTDYMKYPIQDSGHIESMCDCKPNSQDWQPEAWSNISRMMFELTIDFVPASEPHSMMLNGGLPPKEHLILIDRGITLLAENVDNYNLIEVWEVMDEDLILPAGYVFLMYPRSGRSRLPGRGAIMVDMMIDQIAG